MTWYETDGRDLPWRAPRGRHGDPYGVWLSEIMLQQTTVATVGPYFNNFLARWPGVHDLAAASLDDVLHAWQGLGYYARARNLHRCAGLVSRDLDGVFPDSEDALRALPGIGPYTAAAIAAIAFGRASTPVDGNIERVMARLRGVKTPLPAAKPELMEHAKRLTPDHGAGDHVQALMDLGATVCTPRRPSCGRCPWRADCAARAAGMAETLPAKTPKPARPTRRGVAFWAERPDGAVLLRRRPEKGLLGGMMEVPSTAWRAESWTDAAAAAEAPFVADWRRLPGVVGHTFTHFHLELEIMAARGDYQAGTDDVWCAPDRFGEFALPTVMKKIVRHAQTRDG